MRIAITGASGTIGSATARRLGIEGGHRLVGIARRVPETRADGADVEWVSADLTRDACIGTLERAFKGGADAVVRLAWALQPSHDLRYLEELGVGGTRCVLGAVLTSGVPHLVHFPAAVFDHIWIIPMDRRPAVPLVHADDVADAIARERERKVGVACNLAGDPPITTGAIAAALGARPVSAPSSVVRVVASATWHARLQQIDTDWLDLGFAVPLLESSRALRELDWLPKSRRHDGPARSARGYAARCHRRHAGASTPHRRQGAARLRHPGPGRSAGPALGPR